MNVFELGFVVSTIGCAIIGGEKGSHLYGAVGAVVGAVAGAACGLAIALTAVFILGALYCLATGTPIFPKKRPPP